VLFLKSLFCLTGSDNRRRFIAIHLTCYFLFATASSVLSFSGLLSLLALCIFVGIASFSTKRRLNDANLNTKWLLAPTVSFLIIGLIIIISDHSASYWLLFFPILTSALLTTYKSQKNNHIFGYYGNVDLSSYIKKESYQNQTRIEPTFNHNTTGLSQSIVNQGVSSTFVENTKGSENSNKQPEHDIGEAIRLKLFNNKNAVLTLTTLAILVIMAMVLTSVISSSGDEDVTPLKNEIANEVPSQQDSLHEVTLPDNFSLSISSFNGVTIKWQGDASNDDFLWQQLTAQGDKSCMAITYNNNEMIRTLNVIQKDNGDYLARFSPLDTKVIIRNIAKKSSFTLCGYKFSLKGSQSILGKHRFYSEFIVD
jgi:hypothetical protein